MARSRLSGSDPRGNPTPTVMVVDDSLTVRRVTQRLLEVARELRLLKFVFAGMDMWEVVMGIDHRPALPRHMFHNADNAARCKAVLASQTRPASMSSEMRSPTSTPRGGITK